MYFHLSSTWPAVSIFYAVRIFLYPVLFKSQIASKEMLRHVPNHSSRPFDLESFQLWILSCFLGPSNTSCERWCLTFQILESFHLASFPLGWNVSEGLVVFLSPHITQILFGPLVGQEKTCLYNMSAVLTYYVTNSGRLQSTMQPHTHFLFRINHSSRAHKIDADGDFWGEVSSLRREYFPTRTNLPDYIIRFGEESKEQKAYLTKNVIL